MTNHSLWEYNCIDAARTFEIGEALQSSIAKMGLEGPHEFQQRLFPTVLDTMIRGVRIDTEARETLRQELREAILERQVWIDEAVGHHLNIRSSKQMKDFFYKDLKQAAYHSRSTGSETLDTASLEKVGIREPLLAPLMKRIMEMRSMGVFLSTFIEMPLDKDGRVRTSYSIAGAETYRFKSRKSVFGSGGNLQNIPAGEETEGLPNIRKLFIPDPGYTIFDIDLSAADLRIVVWESDEQEMKALLNEGKNPYVEIAREFYHDPAVTKESPCYRTFKSFMHASNYLGSAKGIAQRLGLTVKEAERTQAWYFGKFPRIKSYQEEIKRQIRDRGYVQNIFGYRWYCFERIDDAAFRAAAAYIPQSTIACLINRIWLKLVERNDLGIEILLQVHDSLVGQYPSGWPWNDIVIGERAKIELPYDDPLVIPVGIKTSRESWGEAS